MYSAKHVIIKIVHWTTDMQLHKRMEASNIYLRGLHDYQDIKADGTLNLMAIIISDGPQTFSLIRSDYVFPSYKVSVAWKATSRSQVTPTMLLLYMLC